MTKHTGQFFHNCKFCDYKTNRKYLMTIHTEKRHSIIGKIVDEVEVEEGVEEVEMN